jgi:hypothetical protein
MDHDSAIRARDEASQLRRQLVEAQESLKRQTTRSERLQAELAKHPPTERGPRACAAAEQR